MTLPISYFRFYFPEYVLKTRLPPNCATGFLDSLSASLPAGAFSICLEDWMKRSLSLAIIKIPEVC